MDKRSVQWLFLGLICFTLSNGNWTIPIMAWVAPVFLLRYVHGPKLNQKLIILFLLLIPVTKIMLNEIVPNNIGVLSYILIVYYALLWFIPYWIHSKFSYHKDSFVSTIIFPASAVAVEYLNTVFFGSWASVAYSQYGNLPLMQLASLTGIWGITFITLWFGSTVDWCWNGENTWQRIRNKGWIYGATLLSVLIYGGSRLITCCPDKYSENIISFTPTQAISNFFEKRKQLDYNSNFKMARDSRSDLDTILRETHHEIFQQMKELSGTSASLMMLPEASIDVLEEQESAFLLSGQQFAKQNNMYVLLAYYLLPIANSDKQPENKAVLINPQGHQEYTYLKAYPVPGAQHKGGDGYIPVVETPFGKISTVICYDMDFTGLLHKAGRKKIDLMLVPAWDWEAINPLHAHMAVFRAIENGFSLIRQTGMGLSIATDPTGRTLAKMDYYTSPNNVMNSQVPTRRCPTFYTWIGDAFAWLCILFIATMMFLRITGRLGFR